MDKSKAAVDIFDKYAREYEEQFMDVSLYQGALDIFCRSITKENATVLELGCGPGNITKYLLDKRPDFKILGTDLSAKMLERARVNNPQAEFKILDCRKILSLGTTYDAIMCGFCLPYLSKQETLQLIADAAALLNDNGVLYISTMEDDYSKSGYETGSKRDSMYMYYHEADYIKQALADNDFSIIDLQRKQYSKSDGTEVTDLLVVAGR